MDPANLRPQAQRFLPKGPQDNEFTG